VESAVVAGFSDVADPVGQAGQEGAEREVALVGFVEGWIQGEHPVLRSTSGGGVSAEGLKGSDQ
jgi:hypothetical protein